MKTLAIYAHPDDEILWGFPQMQYSDVERYLYTISDNHNGYDYHAIEALKKVCEVSGIRLVGCLGIANEYYRIATRRKACTLMQDIVPAMMKGMREAINAVKPDRIITHNPYGEYGHGDHRLIFSLLNIMPEANDIEITYTDACQVNKCHLSFPEIPQRIRQRYFQNKIEDYTLNRDWYNPLEEIYKDYGAWSWTGHEVTEQVGLYRL